MTEPTREPIRDQFEGYDVDSQCIGCRKYECGAGESKAYHPHKVCEACGYCGECGHDEECDRAARAALRAVSRSMDQVTMEPLPPGVAIVTPRMQEQRAHAGAEFMKEPTRRRALGLDVMDMLMCADPKRLKDMLIHCAALCTSWIAELEKDEEQAALAEYERRTR